MYLVIPKALYRLIKNNIPKKCSDLNKLEPIHFMRDKFYY